MLATFATVLVWIKASASPPYAFNNRVGTLKDDADLKNLVNPAFLHVRSEFKFVKQHQTWMEQWRATGMAFNGCVSPAIQVHVT